MNILLAIALFSYIYEDTDSLIVMQDTLFLCGDHIYAEKTHISDHSVIFIRPWVGSDSTGWLILNAPIIVIDKNSVLNATGAGYGGGTNAHPDGYGPGYGHAGNNGGGAGGGAAYGGNGGNGGGIPGNGGTAYGNTTDTVIAMGSGGGAGRLSGVEGIGGSGGGMIMLRGASVYIESSDVNVNGDQGGIAVIVAGGAGSGGGILVRSDTMTIHYSSFSCIGGDGGSSDGYGGGGAGGGRIKLFYALDLDTTGFSFSVQSGPGGYGAWESGLSGYNGTWHIENIMTVVEQESFEKQPLIQHSTLARHCLTITCAHIPVDVVIYDCSGRHIKTFVMKNTRETLDISDLSQGVYFLALSKNYSCVSRLIIVR
jgi:hypothetical protein